MFLQQLIASRRGYRLFPFSIFFFFISHRIASNPIIWIIVRITVDEISFGDFIIICDSIHILKNIKTARDFLWISSLLMPKQMKEMANAVICAIVTQLSVIMLLNISKPKLKKPKLVEIKMIKNGIKKTVIII